jgi:predicted aspartyl protease
MKLSIPVQTARITAEQTALLDSGATENFISHQTWRALGIGRQQLDKSIPVHNVDGNIKHYCWLRVIHNSQEKLQ